MMLDLIGGIRGVLAAMTGAALMFGAMSLYDLADDAAVARSARAAEVARFEAESAAALKNALDLAFKAQSDAVEAARRDKLLSDRWHDAQTERMEIYLGELKQKLVAAGRACLLNQSDVDGMRDAGRAAQGGR